MIGFTWQTARPAHHVLSTIFAEAGRNAVGSGNGLVVHVELHVTGDEKIEAAVAVIVTPRGAGGPSAERDTGFFGDVGERAVVIVVIEPILAEVADVDVWPPIVIVIADHRAESPALIGDAGFVGVVAEGSVVIVVEEHGPGSGFFAFECAEG